MGRDFNLFNPFDPFDPKQWSCVQKRVSILDQSGDQTSLVNSSAVVGHGEPALDPEEMHEDTEEIDALLYSESNEQQDEDEAISTGHSPLDMAGDINAPATKRPRIDTELADTASSKGQYMCMNYNEDKSSCVQEIQECNKTTKRKRIQETVGVLRRIIPGAAGGKAKDAAAVLDEAIRYLRSLKLRMKGFEDTFF
ncbi:hypothetical protein J5N97_000085 [Dioscorea zingiberensis]|uniref:BHLH domain-containing protein n=1 Tax=Dioscorea zingiberensis TaxID=325984 RepID=A0A9D5BVM6_9LILI|nr:hypothetical protein J5N97_000085 [Dioscorea zingiberensis]